MAPKVPFVFFCADLGGPWAAQGPKRVVPRPPQNFDWGPDGPPEGPKAPPRAPWGPKGAFWRASFFLKENVHLAPRAPQSGLFFVSFGVLGGQKTPKWRFGGRRVGSINFFGGPFGSFWALRGPKSRFFEISGGTLNATVSHIVPGAPQGPPKDPQGAILERFGSPNDPQRLPKCLLWPR